MAAKNLSSAGKIPAAQLKTLLIIAALALALPLVILAAKYSQDLRSKASYSCLGKVIDINYTSPCNIGATPSATPIPPERDNQNLRVKTNDRPGTMPVTQTAIPRGGQREDSQGNGGGGVTLTPGGYKSATIKCEGGYSEVLNSTVCMTSVQFSQKAQAICNDHAICETPKSESCAKEIKKFTFASTKCDTNSGVTKYKSINFTCLDGYTMDNYNLGMNTCSTTEALLNSASKICAGHLLQSKTFGAKCNLPAYNNGRTEIAAKSISYTCTDGFKSEYKPTNCTSQSNLLAKANAACASRLTCPSETPKPTGIVVTNTPTMIPTSSATLTPPAKCNMTTTPPSCPKGLTCTSSGYCVLSAPTPTVTTNVAPIITTTSLPNGTRSKSYYATVEATDANSSDALNMSFSGLPLGLSQGPCAVPAKGGSITCTISGTPTSAGPSTVQVTVTDNKGNKTVKSLSLAIYGQPGF